MKNFHQLQVWQKAHTFLVQALARVSSRGNAPTDLADSACGGVDTIENVAEGCGRQGDAGLARFCQIEKRSASEIEYQWLLARDLQFLALLYYEALNTHLVEVKRMLNAFLQKLNANG